jgi:hypothetical protein
MIRALLEVLLVFAAAFLLLYVLFLMLRRYASRFEAEQRRRGLWNENGPIHPVTLPPWYRITVTTLPLNLSPSDEGVDGEPKAPRQ